MLAEACIESLGTQLMLQYDIAFTIAVAKQLTLLFAPSVIDTFPYVPIGLYENQSSRSPGFLLFNFCLSVSLKLCP